MKQASPTPGPMKCMTAASLILTAAFLWAWRRYDAAWLLSMAITFGTIAYHLLMRLAVGGIFHTFMGNRADCSKKWYRLHSWETPLYDTLRVKTWKGRLPTYDPDLFSPKKHSWDEIAQAMCQAELVHETNMLLSFVPLLAAPKLGAFGVFLSTSVAAALFDSLFVMMQRYNRPRVLRLAAKTRR